MTRRLLAAWLLLLVGIGCLTQADAYWQSRDSNYNNISSAAPPGYTGPGDVVSGASAFWGLRAYNAASLGNKVANVCNSTGGVDVACADMFSSASTGLLVPLTIGGVACPQASTSVCSVKTWYDQTGNGNDVTQATVANRPTVWASCNGSLPCVLNQNYGSGSTGISPLSTTALAIATNYTIVAAAMTGTDVGYQGLVGINDVGGLYITKASTDVGFIQCGSSGSVTSIALTYPAYYAIAAVCNTGGTASLSFNNSTNSGSVTYGAVTGPTTLLADGQGDPLGNTAQVFEIGFWPSAFSSPQITSMSNNQTAFWGL